MPNPIITVGSSEHAFHYHSIYRTLIEYLHINAQLTNQGQKPEHCVTLYEGKKGFKLYFQDFSVKHKIYLTGT